MGEDLPYKQRVSLSLAFEFTADPSMQPGQIASIQGAHLPPEPEKPGPRGNLDLDTTQMATPSQQSAMG
jgi:hypothetical protein